MIASFIRQPAHPGATVSDLPATATLLIVSAERVQSELLSAFLGDSYHLHIARSEREAMQILEDHAIHLIVLNDKLAGLSNGPRLCHNLKLSCNLAHIPVILLVPPADIPARIEGLEAGADAWIEKPVSRDYFRAQVRNVLANRVRVKEHFRQAGPGSLQANACSGDQEAFLSRLNGFILHHLADTDLNVDTLARLMNMSRPTLYRKIKLMSDLTPNELITVVRLQKAAELLPSAEHKVFEIGKMVGFHSRSNFGKAFLKHFGVTPREYQQMTGSLQPVTT